MTKIAESGPDPLVRGLDPRLRIHTKMSWIRNTDKNHIQSDPMERYRRYNLLTVIHDYCFIYLFNNMFRGLFIIDPSGVLRQMSVNDLPVGRSVDETLRLEANNNLFTKITGRNCPALNRTCSLLKSSHMGGGGGVWSYFN
jgi:alkyl hydroperoxide reductase subunit AhpC